jgi:formylmethanofuran dehydrogenase subunit E
LEEIFEFKVPPYDIPPKAKIYPSIQCEICDEYAGENKIR